MAGRRSWPRWSSTGYCTRSANANEIAQVLSRVLGWEVQYKQVSIETMLTMMASGGQKPPPGHNARALYGEFEPKPERQGDSFAIQHLREVAIDHQNGIFAGTNN